MTSTYERLSGSILVYDDDKEIVDNKEIADNKEIVEYGSSAQSSSHTTGFVVNESSSSDKRNIVPIKSKDLIKKVFQIIQRYFVFIIIQRYR